ncbi:Flp pilus assembly complex ATPase component TadA [Methanothermococcus sp. SCGC AD-155-M21]|nr:Flp pilus assembly complex ATPase component TadA [Methanothermococcus sp. SCGC AD-155-M21]
MHALKKPGVMGIQKLKLEGGFSDVKNPISHDEYSLDIIDSYDIQMDDVVYNVVIGKREGTTYYVVPEVDSILNILSKLSPDKVSDIKSNLSETGLQKVSEIHKYLLTYSEKNNLNLKNAEIQLLAKYFYLIIGKLGFLEIPINDTNLEEIMVNGVNQPTYLFHKKYQMCKTNILFDDDELGRIIDNISLLAGRTIDSRTPMLDAFLPDGSRVNATTRDVTPGGSTLTIRKFSSDPLTIVDLINFGTFNFELTAFLWQAVEGYFGSKPANTLIAGGTGSGKTTTLNVLSMFSMYTDRIATVEDTPELQIPHDHVIKMITRPPRPGVQGYEITMNDLIKNALRMRPDRIFVGEVRGAEAQSLLVAMNTGHDGALIGREPIYLSQGKTTSIGNFVDGFFDKYEKNIVKENNGFEWVEISKENIYVPSFNKKSLRIEDKLITHLWRKEYSGKLLKIKTKGGRNLTLTPDHPLYILKNIIFEVNANMVNVGDYVALPNTCPTSNSNMRSLNPSLTNRLLNNSFYNNINNNINTYLNNFYDINNYYLINNNCEVNTTYDISHFNALPSNYTSTVHNQSNNSSIKNIYVANSFVNIIPHAEVAWDKVISIESIDYQGFIYDLTVKDNHTYIAGRRGGIIVSNCSGTLHANSASEALTRLINPPMSVPKIMLSSLDFIINQQRIKRNRKTIRRILGIVEISGVGEDLSQTNLFEYDGATDSIVQGGICMWEETVCNIAGISREELLEDRINRVKVLKYAVKNKIRDIKSVGKLLRMYQENPENLLNRIGVQ